MKRSLIAVLLSAAVALPASAALKEGDTAPAFQLQASQGGKAFSYSLREALKKGPVVVYFYPSAYTGRRHRGRRIAGQHRAPERILGRSQLLSRQIPGGGGRQRRHGQIL